jgi:hypothetical protein
MDIEQFYDQNPARRTSTEFEYGTDWTDADGGRAELSWVEATGELYVMREPVEPLVADMFGDERLQPLPTELLTVEVLGVVATRAELDRVLAGWATAMGGPGGLRWVRDRLAHGPAPRDASDPDSPDIAFEVHAPAGASVIVSAAIRALHEVLPASCTPTLVVLHEQALTAGSDADTEWHRAYVCARWAERMVSIPAHSHLATEAARALEIVREVGITIGAEIRDLEYLPFGKSVSPRFQTELAWVDEAVHVATKIAEKTGWDSVPWEDLVREMLDVPGPAG